MKKKPEQCTRQGKSNNNIKNFLSNLKENDLHFDDNQISQCVFLGVLRLKPVPSVFTNNKVPSQVIESKPKRFRNNNSTKEVNKNISSKKDINKVISGKIRKKNPDTIKASVKKLATNKKSVIKIKFNMNKNKKGSVSIVPDSLTKISSQDVFQNRTIALNPILTAPAFNPVQNLFDKLKQQMDEKYNRPSSSDISKEILFSSEVNLDHSKSSRKPKKPAKKKPIFERLVMPLLPSNSSLSDNGYYSSSGSMNTQSAKNDVIVINEESCSDEEEVLVNSSPMPSFLVENSPEKNDNEVILIEDTPKCATPNRDLIVIDDSKSTRTSPRLNKQEQKISSNNNQEKAIDSNVINLETSVQENSESTVSSKNPSEKPRKRRTLMPTIPLNFFNTPMLLRSELAQKKGGESRSSMRAPTNKAQKSEKQEKPQLKQRKDKPESKSRSSTENLIYEVVKSSTAISDHITAENSRSSQDDVILVESSPPKVEPLIIKLKVFQNKGTNEQIQENKSQKSEAIKVAKNLFFPRLLRSDINQAKSINEEKSTKSSETSAKLSRKELPPESNQNGPDKTVVKETTHEKISSNIKKTEKTPESPRRQLRSDFAQEKNNNDDSHEKTETVAKTNSNVPIDETALEKSPVQRQSRTQKKLTDSSEAVETEKNSLHQEKSENADLIIIDKKKPRQLRSGVTQNRPEIIDVDETEPNLELSEKEVIPESASARLLRSNQAQKKSTDLEIIDVDKNSPIRDKSPKKNVSQQTSKPNQAQKKPTDLEIVDVDKNSPIRDRSPKKDVSQQTSKQSKPNQAQKKPADLEIVVVDKNSPIRDRSPKKDVSQQTSKQSKPNQAQKKPTDLEIVDVDKNSPIRDISPKKDVSQQTSKQSKPKQAQKKPTDVEIVIVEKNSPIRDISPKKDVSQQTSKQSKANQAPKKPTDLEIVVVDKNSPIRDRSAKKDVSQQTSKHNQAQKKPTDLEIVVVDKNSPIRDKSPKKDVSQQTSKQSKTNQAQKKTVVSEIFDVAKNQEESSKNETTIQTTQKFTQAQKKSGNSEIVESSMISPNQEKLGKKQKVQKQEIKLETDVITIQSSRKEMEDNHAQKKSVESQVNNNLPVATKEKITDQFSKPARFNQAQKTVNQQATQEIIDPNVITVAQFYSPKEKSKANEKPKTVATQKKSVQEKIKDDTNNNNQSISKTAARRSLRSDVAQKDSETKEAPEKPKRDRSKSKTLEERQLRSEGAQKATDLDVAQKPATNQDDNSKKNATKSKHVATEIPVRRHLRSELLTQKDDENKLKNDTSKNVKNIFRYGDLGIDLLDYADLSFDTATPRKLRSDLAQQSANDIDPNKTEGKTKDVEQPQLKRLRSELVQENSSPEIKADVIDLEITNTVKLESSENEKSISEPKIAKRNVSKTRTSKVSDVENVEKPVINRSRAKTKSKPEKIESVTVIDSNPKISEAQNKNTTMASVAKKLQKIKKLVTRTKNTPNLNNKRQNKTKKDSKKEESETSKEEVTIKVEESTKQDIGELNSDRKVSKKKTGTQKNDKLSDKDEKNKKPIKTVKGGKRIRLFGKITKRSNRIQPITNSKKSPKRAEKPNETQKKALRPRVSDIQSTEPSKTRNKSPKKRQADFDEITVVTEKKTKKLKELPPRTLRSSFIPLVIKQEPEDKPVAVVEKVVALIHSEPKPKNVEEITTQKKSKDPKNKDKVKAGVRSTQKLNEIENLEEIKEAAPSRGAKKREESKEAPPSLKQSKKKNPKDTKKSGVSQKSKVITKKKTVEVSKKLRSNTKSTVPKKEKVLPQKKAVVKSNIEKLTPTSKNNVLKQVKSKLKSTKTGNPLKKPEAKKKPASQQKGAISWQSNAIIERIIEELKNTIFIPGNKMKKEQHKLKKQGLNKELVSKKNAIFKKKYVIKSADAKKKLLLTKKKLLQRKLELQKKLRNAKNAESASFESEENNNPPKETNETIEESEQLVPKEAVKEETTIHLVNSYLEEVVIEDDVDKTQSNSMEEFKKSEILNEKPGNIVIINDITVQEKIPKRKGLEILEATKRERIFEDSGEEVNKNPSFTSSYKNQEESKRRHFSIFNKNISDSVVPRKIDLTDNFNRRKDISVFDFDESEPEVGPLRQINTYNENILITSNENTKEASTGIKTTETQTTPVKQIAPSRIESVTPCKTDYEEPYQPLRSVSAQTDTEVVFVKENTVIRKEPPTLSQFSTPPEKPKGQRDRSVIIEELLNELNATTEHEEIDRSHVIEDLLRELNENNQQETFSERILPSQYKAKSRSKVVSPLDEEGKPRKLWSVIENPDEPEILPPKPRTFSYNDISANSTTSNDRRSSSVFSSERPSTLGFSASKDSSDGGDKKSPLKQATIIEMFSKVWMKQDKPTAVRNLGTEDKMFTAMPPPPPPMSVPTGYTIIEPKPRPSETFTAPSPRRERCEDDDSDTESRVEWIPEEYAEYRFKYSAQKMMQKYKPIYRCKVCQLQFPSYYKLIKHRKEHEDKDRPYVCPQCGSQYKDVQDFSAHLRVHKGKHPYMCLKCDMGFWTKKAYEAHLPVHILKKTKQPVKKFRCDVCAKEFSKLCDVERHTRVHTGEKPCVCNICNKRFQQAHNLSKHLLTHLHIKPFQCEICNKQFGRNDVLRRHLLTHSIDKPVKCSICERGFIRHSQLLQHMRKKHPDVPIDQLPEPYPGMSEGEEDDEGQDQDLVKIIHVKREASVGM